MRRLPPLKAIRMFEAAARHQSFAAAADELHVTASAVSHQVKALETYLGIALFRRNKRQVELTPVGEQYLIPIKHALNEIEVATQRLVTTSDPALVTISVAPNFLTRWLMPRMNRFQEQYPDIELQISASTGLIDFSTSNTDMAIYFGHGDWPDIDIHFLRDVLLVPVCSPDLLTGRKPLATPDDLRQHTLISVSKRLHEWPEWLQLAGVDSAGLGRGLQLSSSQLATAAAQEGLGVALADSTLTSREIEEGKLVVPFDIQMDTNKSFYLVYQKGRSLTAGMKAFKDWVMEEMQHSVI
ncbi:transcriptional regulator GcvA [Neptunomonas marina]|uniref:Transcriptional regulator GcvA n=1 Tax=Neptunomonas marina TaxID=1815562 RepID=A0A437QAG7_9GAMM|nr:transcriptional regulator GcvA [Neptunomonas marina]RVU31373.1 transcriptional regulator GcvA [Neptunomonas marina]